MAADLRLAATVRSLRALVPVLPLLAFVSAFALVPAGLLLGHALATAGGPAALRTTWLDPLDRASIDNSLRQGGLSAAGALLLGYPAGVMLGRYRWPGRTLVRSLVLLPFLLPSLVVVLGVRDLFGPGGALLGLLPALAPLGRGTPGIVVANLLFNVPIVLLLTATGCAVSAPEVEESIATLGGSPARAYLEAWGPPTWVGAAAGGLLTFLFSALSFAPPLLLCGPRCYTVEARIYALGKGATLDPTGAGVLALAMVLLFLPATIAYLALLRGLRPRPGGGRVRDRPLPWRTAPGLAMAAAMALVLAAEATLLGAVLYRSVHPGAAGPWGGAWGSLFGPATTARLGLPATGAIANTFLFAGAAGAITLLLAVAASHAFVRRPAWTGPVGFVLFAPLLLSPVVLADALVGLWRPVLGGAAGVWALVIASQTVLALPFAVQSLEVPLAAVPRGAAETARTLGSSPWNAFLDVDLPRVRDGLVTAGLFALALGIGEFTATYFLVTPTFATVPVALYNVAGFSRDVALADALAGLLLVLSLVAFLPIALGGRRAAR